jgi:DNA-3-methyladenine glycosylase
MGTILDRAVLAGPTLDAARSVLGALLVREAPGLARRIGRIVEVEAYVGRDDLASHAHFGRTARNATMFGPPGRAYVYLTYGMHHCLNVVTEPNGEPAALLVRAVEPVEGTETMRSARLDCLERRFPLPDDPRRDVDRARVGAVTDARLASGPGLLCQAFSLDRSNDGIDLCDPASELRLEVDAALPPVPVATSARVGMGVTPQPWHGIAWRFFVPGNRSVSRSPASPKAGR